MKKKVLITISVLLLVMFLAMILSPELRDSFSGGFNKGIGEQ